MNPCAGLMEALASPTGNSCGFLHAHTLIALGEHGCGDVEPARFLYMPPRPRHAQDRAESLEQTLMALAEIEDEIMVKNLHAYQFFLRHGCQYGILISFSHSLN